MTTQLQQLTERARRRPHSTFGSLGGVIALAVIGVLVLGIVERHEAPVLPIEFRLIQPSLSHLPVHIDRIRSCSCWHGPRSQAQRKYKFRVINYTNHEINIGGGPHSVIRLIVAYPNHHHPVMTMPAKSNHERPGLLNSPPDIQIPITEKIATIQPNEIRGSNQFFGVPKNWSVWALPATPNKLAELTGGTMSNANVRGVTYGSAEEASYPTVVDKTELLPGEEYESHKRGHGTWTFYIPIPEHMANIVESGAKVEPLLSREFYEHYVTFVGVAALLPGTNGGVHLLGFGPAPSENGLADPGAL